jgi:hypothetical protein
VGRPVKKETYCLPIIVTIIDEEPNRIVKKIADAIYDGIQEIMKSSETNCEAMNVEYSIFIKGKENEFKEERQ